MAADLTSPASIGPWGTNRPPALLPCPFCGAEPRVVHYVTGAQGDTTLYWSVECNSDDCNGTAETEAEAVAYWNKRVQP